MPLRTRPLRAVIFDMDGTLVDSERIIMRAWLSAAQQAGRPIDPEFYVKVIGLNVEESDRVLLDHLG
ncbi:MAG: HAD family phosphatase, partial [Propionivibrio sp.]|nr:HAD family phosphatase [Propionivibrio sp.]